MELSTTLKTEFKNSIRNSLNGFTEIDKVVLFGSFVKSDNPNDIDIAIIQNSNDNYLTLSLKYRKALRNLSKKIPLDVLPIKHDSSGSFLSEIEEGEVLYEK